MMDKVNSSAHLIGRDMASRINQPLHFTLILLSLCLFYLGFEFFFNAYAMVTVDEFWFAHNIYHYKDSLPYRDFSPYKTVLGYYLLLPPMLSARGIIQTLIFTKNSLACVNALILFASAWWLSRFFSRYAVILSLAVLIFAEIVLSYSTNIRVDLLSYWLCFFSLLLLLEKRFLLAGVMLGLGFITSQKAIWYLFASNIALAAVWLVCERKLKFILNIARYNCMSLGVIVLYIACWAVIADGHTVINNIFYDASALYHLDWYDNARQPFWAAIIFYNPLLFLLWPLTLISLFVTFDGDVRYAQRLFIVVYAHVVLLCLIAYKQVFPYYMQATIPIFFALYAAFFAWLFALFQTQQPLHILLLGRMGMWGFMFCYTVLLVFLQNVFQLPYAYLFLCLPPFLLGLYLNHKDALSVSDQSIIARLLVITLIFTGSFYPINAFLVKLININGAYQKANLETMTSLLQDGSDYVAGIELIYNKTQPIAGMRHLMGPAIDYLRAPTEKLKQVMLASLYEDPNVTADSVITALKKSNVKFYVNNYRMMALPKNIKNFLAAEYMHYWGSIYLYAPQITRGKQLIRLKFSGRYRLISSTANDIRLNGKHYAVGSTPYLTKGDYTSLAKKNYRMKLMPEQARYLNLNFKDDDWRQFVF